MTSIVVSGAAGRMGRAILQQLQQSPQARLVAAIETAGNPVLGSDAGVIAGVGSLGVKITDDFAASLSPETIVIEFSTPAATLAHLRACVQAGSAMVIGTTGYNDSERAELDELSAKTACVVAANMSVGVNVLLKLVSEAAKTLATGFDPEIVEMHHRMKVDSPSGTALALARAVVDNTGRDLRQDARYGREGIVGKRTVSEIGILALRGGDVVGDHTVIFAGAGERIELTHRAQSRDCLASGAVRAALWLAGKPKARYSMSDVLGL